MQEEGEPLRLNYIKHHYGPYADNLRHALTKIEGHLGKSDTAPSAVTRHYRVFVNCCF